MTGLYPFIPSLLLNEQIEKLKEPKLNKKMHIAKTLEAFKPKAKFFLFKNTYFKNMFKTNFCF